MVKSEDLNTAASFPDLKNDEQWSSSKLASKLKMSERIAGGVFCGRGIGCGCSPLTVTRIYGHSWRYSSSGSYTRNLVSHERFIMTGLMISPFSFLWSDAVGLY